jgi:hypothetical protein
MGTAWARHGRGMLCVNPPLVALQSPLNGTVTQRQQLPKAEATVLGQSKEKVLKYCKRQIRSVLKLCPDM